VCAQCAPSVRRVSAHGVVSWACSTVVVCCRVLPCAALCLPGPRVPVWPVPARASCPCVARAPCLPCLPCPVPALALLFLFPPPLLVVPGPVFFEMCIEYKHKTQTKRKTCSKHPSLLRLRLGLGLGLRLVFVFQGQKFSWH